MPDAIKIDQQSLWQKEPDVYPRMGMAGTTLLGSVLLRLLSLLQLHIRENVGCFCFFHNMLGGLTAARFLPVTQFLEAPKLQSSCLSTYSAGFLCLSVQGLLLK